MSQQEKEQLMTEVESALDDIRPHLKVDGGNVELVELTDDFRVKVRWVGNCESCNMSTMTLRAGIEQTVRAKIPTITAVEAINGIEL